MLEDATFWALVGLILFLILMSFTLLQLVASKRWVYYEGSQPEPGGQ